MWGSRILIVFFVLVFYQKNYAQEHIIKGTVTDSLQKPLGYANVMAEPLDKKLTSVFSLTDLNGQFKLSLLQKKTYKVSVAYMGYETVIFTVDSLTNNLPKHIILKPKKENLNEVVIISDVAVKVYKDSVVYNTKKLTDGTERKLKDIMKKLPGVEVDKQGTVRVMGQKVDKIMVEGKDFFGGGTKLAMNHIPADAVDGIVAIKDYHNIGFMKGLTDRQKMVINVKLKEGKKKFVFGDLLAGKGNKDYYEGKANLFYFSPKTTFTFLGNSNNTGENVLTFEDFRHFEQSDMMDFEQMKSTFKSYSILSQFLFSDNFISKKQHFGALQWQQDFGSKISFNTFGVFARNNIYKQRQNILQFLNAGQYNFTEHTETQQSNENIYALGKIHFAYKQDYFHRLNYNMLFKKNIFTGKQDVFSKLNNSPRFINKLTNNDLGSVTQDLSFHYKMNRHHVFRFLAEDVLSDEMPEYAWQTDQDIFNDLIPDLDQQVDNISQTTPKNSHRLNMTLTHFWLINNRNHIYTSTGYAYYNHHLMTKTFQTSGNGLQNDFSSIGFDNDMKLSLKDIFAGLKYKFKWKGKFFKPGIFLHKYFWHINEKHLPTLNKQKLLLLPELYIEWPTANQNAIDLDYKLKAGFSEPHKFLPRYYILSYNSLESGNINLKNELYHDLTIKWREYSLSKKRNMRFRFHYKQMIYGLYNTVEIEQGNTYTKPVIKHVPDKSLSVSFYYKKGFKYWYFNLLPMVYYHNYSHVVNQQWTKTQSLNQLYNLNIVTKFNKYPNINLGLSGNYSNSIQNRQDYSYTNYEYQFGVSYSFKHYSGELNWSQERVLNAGFKPMTHNNLDVNLMYSNNTSPFVFELSFVNILNENHKTSYMFNDYFSARQTIFRQGFRAMFKISYVL